MVSNKVLVAAVVLVILVWFFVPYLAANNFTIEKSGLVGDTFNIVTSLFSALAFLGVVYTIILQRADFASSRDAQRDQINIALQTSKLQSLRFMIDDCREELIERSTGGKVKTVPRSIAGLNNMIVEMNPGGALHDQPDEVRELLNRLISLKREVDRVASSE